MGRFRFLATLVQTKQGEGEAMKKLTTKQIVEFITEEVTVRPDGYVHWYGCWNPSVLVPKRILRRIVVLLDNRPDNCAECQKRLAEAKR